MMKTLFRFVYRCHKWFGLPLAVMFLVWYVSGIVMLYHRFPRLTPSTTPVERVDPESLRRLWGSLTDTISSMRLFFSADSLLADVNGELYGGYTPAMPDLERIAHSFGTRLERVDTLEDIDKWIPFDRLMRHLPIYRITGADRSFTYVSSRTGEVLQHNTLSARRWAWVGALPHYVYVTPLRRDAGLWRKVVIWMSGLSTVSVLFGLVVAVRFLVRRRRFRIFRKRIWQWHYSFGLVFGLFMLAFIFSGMMSLADIPEWLVRERPVHKESGKILKNDLDIASVPARFGVVSLSCASQPMLEVVAGESSYVRPALREQKLDFSPAYMTGVVERLTGEKVESVSEVTDDLFYSRDAVMGYRAETPEFSAYWNDRGYFRILDRKGKAKTICYRIIHNMDFPILRFNPVIHDIFMWIILLGGLVVVVTGTALSLRAIAHDGKIGKSPNR